MIRCGPPRGRRVEGQVQEQHVHPGPADEAERRPLGVCGYHLGHGVGGDALAGVRLHATQAERASLAGDPTGDRLDAAIAALQAAWCWLRRDAGFGLPGRFDPCEGWIAGVPSPDRADATP